MGTDGMKTDRLNWQSRSVLVSVLLAVLLPGCGEPGSEDVLVHPPGTTVVVNDQPSWEEGSGWTINSAPELLVPQDPEVYFHRVSGAVLLSDGSIAVADAGRDEILLFRPDGSLGSVFGGKGEGPDEFVSLSRIGIEVGDTLVAWENNALRRKRFDKDGTLVSIVEGPLDSSPRGIEGWVGSPDGVVMMKMTDQGSAVPPQGVVRPPRYIVRVGPAGQFDTITVLPGPEMVFLNAPGGMKMPSTTLFAPNAEIAGGGNPWIIASGDGAEPEFQSWGEDGRLRMVVTWNAGRQDLTKREVAVEREERIEGEVQQGRSPTAVQRKIDQLPSPVVAPVYRTLFVDDLGRTWVERYPRTGVDEGSWVVFDPEGNWLGQTEFPIGTRPLQIGEDFIVGLRTDSLGVHTVGVFRIHGS